MNFFTSFSFMVSGTPSIENQDLLSATDNFFSKRSMETSRDTTHNEASVAGTEIQRREESRDDEVTKDGSLNIFGRPALKGKSGGWRSGVLLLVSHGLSSLAFVGLEVNLVLFSTRVLKQTNAEAANTFSRWLGSVHLCSLVGAFISDSYWGRYKTCAVFQLIFILGLVGLSIITHLSLLKPHGCGKIGSPCESHSSLEFIMFYLSIYLIALGNGGNDPALAAFGADQFDEEDKEEKQSKVSFFSYFYVAVNLGSLLSETVLAYIQNLGNWVMGFWVSTGSAVIAYMLLLSGTLKYRCFKPSGNPIARFLQVIVASLKKMKLELPSDSEVLYEVRERTSSTNGGRRIFHTEDFKFLDRAAIITAEETMLSESQPPNPWRLCTVTQVEEEVQTIKESTSSLTGR